MFRTRDREYTAQIQKRVRGAFHYVWVPCGNTTFIVHAPASNRDHWEMERERLRIQMMYGARITSPKISTFDTGA